LGLMDVRVLPFLLSEPNSGSLPDIDGEYDPPSISPELLGVIACVGGADGCVTILFKELVTMFDWDGGCCTVGGAWGGAGAG
jgi:hypothetical protein